MYMLYIKGNAFNDVCTVVCVCVCVHVCVHVCVCVCEITLMVNSKWDILIVHKMGQVVNALDTIEWVM